MASLGEAYVDVHANTDKVAPEIEAGVKRAAEEVEKKDDFGGIVKAADKAGSRAGNNFGKSFIRDASGRLRDEKGRFVQDGEKVGKEVGDKMAKGIGDELEKKTKGKISSLGKILAPAWIRTIGAWIAAAAPAAIQLAGTLAPAVGILAALVPAAIGGAAAIGILKISFSGLSKLAAESTTNVALFNQTMAGLGASTQTFVHTLISLQPVLKTFKADLQNSFFASFNDVTFSKINNALGVLRNNLNGIAYTLGGALSQAANTALTGKGLGKLNSIFGSFDDTLLHLGPILSNLISTLLTLGQTASPLLESLVGGLDRATKRFDVFIQKAAANGSLKKFFDSALIAFNQLIKLSGYLLKIVGDILDAGAKAGGGNTLILFFGELADIVDQLNKSGALTSFFEVINTFFGSISAIIKPLLPLVSQLIKLFGGELVKVLTILTPPLTEITKAIADALIPALPSLQKAIDALSPVLGIFAQVLADVIKQITPEVSKVLIDLFTSLALTLVDLAPSIKALLPELGQLVILLVHLLSTQTIAALQIFILILPGLAKAINTVLVPALNTVTSILKPLNQLFSEFVIPFVSNFAANAIKTWDGLAKIADKVGKFFKSAGKDIGDFFTKTIPKWFAKIGDFFTHLPENLEKLLKKAIKKAFDTVLIAVGVGIGLVIFAFTKLPGKIINGIGDLGAKLFRFLGGEWDKAVASVSDFTAGVIKKVEALPGKIVNALAMLGPVVKKAFKDAFDNAVKTVSDTFDKVVGFVRGLPHRIETFTAKLVASGIKLVTGFLNGLSHPGKLINSISDTIFGFLKDKINYVIDKLNQGIDKVGKFVGGLPHIPRLAKGAIIDHPTLALIGETGKREVVVPTDDAARAQQLLDQSGLSKMLGFHSSAPNVMVSVYIGDRELTQIVDTRVSVANTRTARQLAYGTRTP